MEKAPCKLIILGRAAIKDENMDDEESAKIPDLKEMKTLIARRFKAAGYKGDLTFELNSKNKPERDTHRIYAGLDFEQYIVLAFERAKKFKELML